MTKTELKADMELTKISIQAFVAFLFAIMLQVITGKISMQIYSGFTIFTLLMIVALMSLALKVVIFGYFRCKARGSTRFK